MRTVFYFVLLTNVNDPSVKKMAIPKEGDFELS